MPDPIITAADFTRLLNAEAREHLGEGLTLARYTTLVHADGATVADLARRAGVTHQMAWKTVHELQLLGYVAAGPARVGRHRRLRVTGPGRAALTRAGALQLSAPLLAAMELYVAAKTDPQTQPGNSREAAPVVAQPTEEGNP